MLREIVEGINEGWAKGKSYDGTAIVKAKLKSGSGEYEVEIGIDDNDEFFATLYTEDKLKNLDRWEDFGDGQYQLSGKYLGDIEKDIKKVFPKYKRDNGLFSKVLGDLGD